MRRRIMVVATVAALVVTSAAIAAGQHFTQQGFPVCTDIGTQVECTAEIAGLGQQTVVARLTASGSAINTTCTSPGGNESPGQNPAVPVTAGGEQSIDQPDNGRQPIDVSTATPSVTPKAAGCPNKNWAVSFSDVVFTTYTLVIRQGGQTLFTCTGAFSPSPSQNGQQSTPTCT
jgi:hypothetical protein